VSPAARARATHPRGRHAHGLRQQGARSEEIRKFLKVDKRELPRVLKAGLEKKVLQSEGQKRATRYFAM